jgi:hypothetical protein
MLTTIILGTCVSVQGIFERRHDNGMLTVRVGERLYTGRPISRGPAA